MKKQIRLCLYITTMMLTVACSKHSQEDEQGVTTVLPTDSNHVTIEVLTRRDFSHELVSNGKVRAKEEANLRFEAAGILAKIHVKNGDKVHRGQKLAELDRFRLSNEVARTKNAMEQAQLEMQDILIGQGFPANDHSRVPEEVMKLAAIKSGYNSCKIAYELACYEEEHATLTAPFDGIVANLFSKPFNQLNTTEVFCTVMDTQNMEVDFTILESELPFVKVGDKVVVTPYANTQAQCEGRIIQVNPIVNDEGIVKVKAAVYGSKKLFSGMNVRINVQRSLGQQLVIPKSAVVLRSGKQVVFTLHDGKAQWNYVHTALENATCYSIADGLQEGDTIIVTGNVNLAHEAEVKIIENKEQK